MNVTEPIFKELPLARHYFWQKFLCKYHKYPTKYLAPGTKTQEDAAREESLPTEEEGNINFKYQLYMRNKS